MFWQWLASQVIKNLLSFFLDSAYYYPHSSDLMALDVSISFGKHLEQLIRHYPETFESVVLDSLVESLLSLLSGAVRYKDDVVVFDQAFGQILNSAVSLMTCLEQILEKKTTIKLFMKQKGIELLFRMKSLSVGPARSFLVSAASNHSIQEAMYERGTGSTSSFLGYPPLESVIQRCFERIISCHDLKEVFETAWQFLRGAVAELELSLSSYWDLLGSEQDSWR